MKEHLQWFVDRNEYYSSTRARYLEFVTDDPHVTREDEAMALANAMRVGAATNRVVILPAFRCHGCSVAGKFGTKSGCSGVCSLARRRRCGRCGRRVPLSPSRALS
jgi:hypothetical protein